MKHSETLPRLAERKSMVCAGAADDASTSSPKFLGRMSWQKGLLEVSGNTSSSDSLFSLVSPTKRRSNTLSGSASTPTLVTLSCVAPVERRGSQFASKAVPNQGGGGGKRTAILSYEESMDDVERMLREHMQQVQRQRASAGGKSKVISTLKQSAARRDPAKCEFEFAPLQDGAMIAATNELRPSDLQEEDEDADEDGEGDGCGVDEARDPSSKYYGENAKAAYYKTYHELHGKTHLFIEKPKKRVQARTLKASAALTTALDLRKASILKSMVQVKKTGTEDDKGADGVAVTHRKTLQPLLLVGNPSESDTAAAASILAAASSSVSSPSLHSPRVLFLSACIAKSHPAISLVLRKRNTNTFDFSHQSLGDEFMTQFAACLPDLPHVEAINACDNRLSDRALDSLLVALENKPNLTKLDISENEIGRDSARSLRKYIASSLCTLKTLVLNDADIDDHECTLFMIAFEQNKSVERLLMASNRIGQTRKTAALGTSTAASVKKLNDKDPGIGPLPTGGESIGSMLNVNLTIQELDLSWNMLRQNSTKPIANALQLNYNLCELNLSYNGCGDGGAMQLGHALRTNATLQKLNIAYNSIGPKGGLVLGSGLIVNKGLKELILDGNPIGLDSGRELMHASCSRIHTAAVCTLSMFECNLTTSKRPRAGENVPGANGAAVETNVNVYNPSDPAGKYNLDLSDPYEHMIAHELLRLATFKRGYRFAKVEHVTATLPKTVTKIELHREANRKSSIVPVATPATSSTPPTQSSLSLLFEKIDKDRSGFVDHTELGEAMRAYGIRISDELLERVLAEYDYDKSGALGIDEFEDFFLRCGFAVVDTDHSGALNEQEVEKVLKLMGFEDITQREIKRMMSVYDLNGSGEIDEHEFIEFMKAEVLQAVVKQDACGEEMTSLAARSLEESYERTALREANGAIWKVPTSGFLAVDFQYDVDTMGVEDEGNHGHHLDMNTKQIASNAISQLLGNSQKVSKNGAEQTDFLRAVLDTADLFFTANQAEEVIMKQGAMKSWARKLHALERLLPQMINRHEASTLVNRLVDQPRQWQQRRELRRKVPKLFSILLGCPTSRYRFDLQLADDRAVLKQLATFAHHEKLFSKNRSGRHDTSQNGDWENFRNAKVNGQVWLLTSTFILNSLLGPSNLAMIAKAEGAPGNAVETFLAKRIVEFDYVSTTRPPRGTKPLSLRRFDQLFEVWMRSDEVLKDAGPTVFDEAEGKSIACLRWQILRNHVFSRRKQQQQHHEQAKPRRISMLEMKTSLDGIYKKLELLEMLVCERWVSCEQAATLITELPDAIFARARAATLLFSRIVDLENFITIIDNLSHEDQMECVKRLGWLNIFDPAQPDRQYPPLDLAVHDERELVQLLSKLALAEGAERWKRASYRVSSTDSSLTRGQVLPLPGWGNPEAVGEESLKHHGIIRLRYESASAGEDGEQPWDATLRVELRNHTLCGTRLFLQ